MTLPHPHGNASGEIGHNSIYDTGVTPGSTGGKFIGFGEEGTSSVGNRAHWALSENIDYVYQILASDMALPAGASFTAVDQGGGGQLKYQITDDVWVGDGTYPGSAGTSDPEGMLMLFAVLDDQYNELTDGSGNEVRVKLVRDSTEVNDVYQGGSPFIDNFITNPYIYFHTVDPSTGAEVDASYDIPTGTSVRILYPKKGNMENLPADAFTRYKVQSATEVEAGAFLQDGSKKMTGHADWDSHRIDNVLEVRGVSGLDLSIRSLSDDLFLIGGTDIKLRDQNTSPAGVAFSQTGQGAPYNPTGSYNTSVLGALNSQIKGSEVLRGNRALNRTGAFTSSTVGPSLNYPALDMLVNGETIQVAAGNVDLSFVGTGNVYVFYNPGADAVQGLQTFFPSSLPTGAVMLWKGYWSGSAWSSEYDLRWPSNRQGTHEAWFVGDGVGADFSDINLLATVLNQGLDQVGAEDLHKSHEIVVCGEAAVTSTFNLPTGWTLRGLATKGSGDKIKTDVAFTAASNVISTGQDCTVKDLEIEWAQTSAHQSSTYAAIYAGLNSIVENVKFSDGSFSFRTCVWSGGSVRVRNCDMGFCSYQGYGIETGGYDRITDCLLGPFSTAAVGCVHFGNAGNVLDGGTVSFTGPSSRFFYVGDIANSIRNVVGVHFGLGTVPFIQLYDSGAGGVAVTVENCSVVNGYRFISSALNNLSLVVQVRASGNLIQDMASTVFDFNNTAVGTESAFVIKDNLIDGTVAGYALYANYCSWVEFCGNTVVNNTASGVRILPSTGALIDGNYIEGYGSGNAVRMGGLPSTLCNNIISDVGAPVSVQVNAESIGNRIVNNYLQGGANAETGVSISNGLNVVMGNVFSGHIRRGVWVYGDGHNTKIDGNVFYDVGAKTDTYGPVGPWFVAEAVVFLESNTGTLVQISVSNNHFVGCYARGIVTGPRTGTPGVRGLVINGNVFAECIGGYMWNNGGFGDLTEEGMIRVEYGGGAGLGNVISNNSIIGCGHDTWFSGTTKVWYAIYSSANQAVISGNNIDDMIGGHNPAYNLEGVVGIQIYDGAIVANNMIFKSLNSNAPYGYDGIAVHGSGHGIVSNNFIYSDGTPPAGMGMYRGYIFGGSVLVNCVGNMHRGTVVNYAGGIYAYNTSRSSATAGIEIGNYAETGPCSMGGANVLVMGNINDNLGMVHTVTGLPTAYTANPVADWNFKI
jgi:hypothetical protein